MKFPPIYMQTSVIKQYAYELDVLKTANSLQPILESKARFLRQARILKSSLFSARIEGNPLTLDNLHQSTPNEDAHVLEVSNLSRAYELLDAWKNDRLSRDLIKRIHTTVMNDLSANAGTLRTEESAIFNHAGIAVYITPPPQAISNMLDSLIGWIRESNDAAPLVSAVAHIWFEKIHPFDDGNGRVGRLLSALILEQGDYGFGGIVPLEEYLEKNRERYYGAIGKDSQDVSFFIEFFLEALVSQVKESFAQARSIPAIRYPNLLPRRAELVEIVVDHKMVTFDFLARRFRKIPPRTLHYDLAQLIKVKYVRRLGTTRGALYAPGEQA